MKKEMKHITLVEDEEGYELIGYTYADGSVVEVKKK